MARTPSPTQTGSGPGRGPGRNRPEETTGENPRPGGQTVKPRKPRPKGDSTSGWGKNLGDKDSPDGDDGGFDFQDWYANLDTGNNPFGVTGDLLDALGLTWDDIQKGGNTRWLWELTNQRQDLAKWLIETGKMPDYLKYKLADPAASTSAWDGYGEYMTAFHEQAGHQLINGSYRVQLPNGQWVSPGMAARIQENELSAAAEETPAPANTGGGSFVGGFDVEGALGPLGNQELYQIGSALFGMLGSRAARENAQSAYGDYFEEPGGES